MKKLKKLAVLAILAVISVNAIIVAFKVIPEAIIPFSFIGILLVGSFFSALFDTIKANRIAARKREKARLEAIKKQQEDEYNKLVAYNQMLSTKK